MTPKQYAKSPQNKLRLIFTISFCLCLCSVTEAQNTKSINFAKEKSVDSAANEIYIFLSPFEKRGAIEVEDSCLVLLRDATMEISFPLGRIIKTTLPAGIKYFVPKGKYEIANPTDSYIEYRLLAPDLCRE